MHIWENYTLTSMICEGKLVLLLSNSTFWLNCGTQFKSEYQYICDRLLLCGHPNTSNVCVFKGLGARFKTFNDKPCHPVCTKWLYTYGKRNRKPLEMVICTCVAAKLTKIYVSLLILLSCRSFKVFIRHLVWIGPCGMFDAGGACTSIRYCTSIRKKKVVYLLLASYVQCICFIFSYYSRPRPAQETLVL